LLVGRTGTGKRVLLAKPYKTALIFRLKYFGNDSAFASYRLTSMENTRFLQTLSLKKINLEYLTRAVFNTGKSSSPCSLAFQ
jgi:hypothetical protein